MELGVTGNNVSSCRRRNETGTPCMGDTVGRAYKARNWFQKYERREGGVAALGVQYRPINLLTCAVFPDVKSVSFGLNGLDLPAQCCLYISCFQEIPLTHSWSIFCQNLLFNAGLHKTIPLIHEMGQSGYDHPFQYLGEGRLLSCLRKLERVAY